MPIALSDSLVLSGSILQNGGALAAQDGTILYHNVRWFTPSSTVSTSGTTVTSVGTQFQASMVGTKLTILGESRIITAHTSTTQVTVDSAYSQNYSGVAAGSWGVYSRSFANVDSTNTNVFYNSGGTKLYYIDANGNNIFTPTFTVFNSNLEVGSTLINTNYIALASGNNIRWSGDASNEQLTKDLGIRRNATGSLEIYNGVTADGAVANRRDLILRNITGSNATFSGSVTVGGTLTAQTLVVQTITSSVDFITGSARFGSNTGNTHQFTGSVLVSGSVGFGTSSPVSSLHINEVNSITLSKTVSALSSSVGAIEWRNNYASPNYVYAKIDVVTLGTSANPWDHSNITFSTWNGFNSLTERMRIANTGNVGIGTNAPTFPLQINKAGTANSIMTQTVLSLADSNGWNLGSDGTHALIGVTNSSTDMIFLKRVAGVYSEAMRITSGGILQLGNGGAQTNTFKSILEDTTNYSTQFYNSNNKNTFQIGGGSSIAYNDGAYISLMGSDRYGTSTAGVLTLSAGNAVNNTGFGFIELKTGNAARMTINYDGRIQTTVSGVNGQFQIAQTDAAYNTDAMLYLHNNRNATSSYNFAKFFSGYPNNTQDIEFNFRGDGVGYSDGGWSTPASDYAEYFESTDGTALQIGSTVVLENGKIRQATESSTNIIGVIRPKNAVLFLGNNEGFKWNQKYLKDDFGAYILDAEGMRTLNPEYDSNVEYISRENRDEWNVVGLVGQVPLLKNQPVNPNWVKMYTISDTVEMWLIK